MTDRRYQFLPHDVLGVALSFTCPLERAGSHCLVAKDFHLAIEDRCPLPKVKELQDELEDDSLWFRKYRTCLVEGGVLGGSDEDEEVEEEEEKEEEIDDEKGEGTGEGAVENNGADEEPSPEEEGEEDSSNPDEGDETQEEDDEKMMNDEDNVAEDEGDDMGSSDDNDDDDDDGPGRPPASLEVFESVFGKHDPNIEKKRGTVAQFLKVFSAGYDMGSVSIQALSLPPKSAARLHSIVHSSSLPSEAVRQEKLLRYSKTLIARSLLSGKKRQQKVKVRRDQPPLPSKHEFYDKTWKEIVESSLRSEKEACADLDRKNEECEDQGRRQPQHWFFCGWCQPFDECSTMEEFFTGSYSNQGFEGSRIVSGGFLDLPRMSIEWDGEGTSQQGEEDADTESGYLPFPIRGCPRASYGDMWSFFIYENHLHDGSDAVGNFTALLFRGETD